ncbi:MAG: alpha-L-fucosidase [Verrucomicrobiales bacterium]|nr:alpha-L-fucosidase [Verrucomicrobiales bacterium]
MALRWAKVMDMLKILAFLAALTVSAVAGIPYATEQIIADGDSDAVIIEKAAKVLPRPNQSAWMRMERTFFIHFGPNTFNHVEWGTGRERPADFKPTAFDAEQWVRAAKEAGGRMILPVCKHHDGFCLWPSRYTAHSVAASPWLAGKGDVLRAVTDAARKHGLTVGVYLSPADLYQLRTNTGNPDGYYGNGSAKRKSVIPTDPAGFKSNPAAPCVTVSGTFTYEVDDYNRYFLNQLYELLTEYGAIHEVWFDGANPSHGVKQAYDYAAWYDLIRRLQPRAVIFGKGPDGRWIGNESGNGRETEWSVVPLPVTPDDFNWPDMRGQDLGSRAKLKPGSHLWWYPAEADVPILHGWFWAPGKRARHAAELVETYYRTVGRNSVFLLNLSPDERGLVPDEQLAPLRLSSRIISETFAKNLADGGKLEADSSNPAHVSASALDGNLDTWWEAAAGKTAAELVLRLPSAVEFDVVSMQEAVDKRGQRIESFDLDVWDGAAWRAAETVEGRSTVGYKRLSRLKTPATTERVRLRINQSRLEPTLAEFGLFKQVPPPPPPKPKPVGVPPEGWTVIAADSEETARANNAARNAIDGDPATHWHSRWGRGEALPLSLTVDMGAARRIAGLVYLPRQDGNSNGTVSEYRFEVGEDGKGWTVSVEHGRFDNVKNNPIAQEIRFTPLRARYFRFTALREVDGKGCVSAAEISVLPE